MARRARAWRAGGEGRPGPQARAVLELATPYMPLNVSWPRARAEENPPGFSNVSMATGALARPRTDHGFRAPGLTTAARLLPRGHSVRRPLAGPSWAAGALGALGRWHGTARRCSHRARCEETIQKQVPILPTPYTEG